MATNPIFNFYDNQEEQELLQDLIVELIQMYGHDVIYIPCNVVNYDALYDTDDQSTYSTTIPVEMLIESIDGFTGRKDIFTKFGGVEIRDSVTMCIAKRTFEQVIKPITKQPRPMERDLVYFTMNKKCFQISYVSNKEMFFPLGELPTYTLELSLFEYSSETFNTGIPEIDKIQAEFSLNAMDHEITLPNGLPLSDPANNVLVTNEYDEQNVDPLSDNQLFKNADVSLIDFSVKNVIGKINI